MKIAYHDNSLSFRGTTIETSKKYINLWLL